MRRVCFFWGDAGAIPRHASSGAAWNPFLFHSSHAPPALSLTNQLSFCCLSAWYIFHPGTERACRCLRCALTIYFDPPLSTVVPMSWIAEDYGIVINVVTL
ncbi:hypothetical protein M404DRAFT_1004806 [Pisolithus tinctorius Marx 270]|uniref:Uncharacterized protein n=1 Tax=Pisolithus tinctorius Marx 270 TaxID=870435 RepID=A0A0C3NV83_PISTI|nr:hypothetical protein M404DRAFT_1004806 [Pisolithus tinctorius Marx 270]